MSQLSSVTNAIPEPSGHSFRPCRKSGRYHPGIAGRVVPESVADIIPESVAESFRNTQQRAGEADGIFIAVLIAILIEDGERTERDRDFD